MASVNRPILHPTLRWLPLLLRRGWTLRLSKLDVLTCHPVWYAEVSDPWPALPAAATYHFTYEPATGVIREGR